MSDLNIFRPEIGPGPEGKAAESLTHIVLLLGKIEQHLSKLAASAQQICHLEGQRLSVGEK